MDSLKVSLLKCTTASETLVMHRTTFLCLSLVPVTGTRAVGVGQNDLKAWSGETRVRGGSTSKGRKGGLLRDATRLEQLNRMLVLYSYMCPNSIGIVEGKIGIEG